MINRKPRANEKKKKKNLVMGLYSFVCKGWSCPGLVTLFFSYAAHRKTWKSSDGKLLDKWINEQLIEDHLLQGPMVSAYANLPVSLG